MHLRKVFAGLMTILKLRRLIAFRAFQTLLAAICIIPGMTMNAVAQDGQVCPDHRPRYSLGIDKPFIFSTACTQVSDSQVEIQNRVCPTSKKSIAFHWTRLNWVSGASGVDYGDCLVLRFPDPSAAIKIADSKIVSNTNFSPTTEVFAPDLGQQGNRAYTESLEGNASVKEGGEKEPFRLSVTYQFDGESEVSISAAMSGREPSFLILLPPEITGPDTLNEFLREQDLDRLAPLVEFGSGDIYLASALNADVSAEYIEVNEIDIRAVIQVKPEDFEASFVALEFAVVGNFQEGVSDLIFCAMNFGEVSGCF